MPALVPSLPMILPTTSGTPLEAERKALEERIKKLPPNSHRRIALQYKARLLTNQIFQNGADSSLVKRDAE